MEEGKRKKTYSTVQNTRSIIITCAIVNFWLQGKSILKEKLAFYTIPCCTDILWCTMSYPYTRNTRIYINTQSKVKTNNCICYHFPAKLCYCIIICWQPFRLKNRFHKLISLNFCNTQPEIKSWKIRCCFPQLLILISFAGTEGNASNVLFTTFHIQHSLLLPVLSIVVTVLASCTWMSIARLPPTHWSLESSTFQSQHHNQTMALAFCMP